MKTASLPERTHRAVGFRCACDGPGLADVVDTPVLQAAARKRAWIRTIDAAVSEDCHLTVDWRTEGHYPDRRLTLALAFDNSSMVSYWSPEVAVQYIFAATLQPILKRLTRQGLFDDVEKFRFRVEPRPHAEPERISFELMRYEWTRYVENTWDPLKARARLYRTMRIHGSPGRFHFDAEAAAGIE